MLNSEKRIENGDRVDRLIEIKREVFKLNNTIAKINFTKKHYISWMECSDTEPSQTFIQYLDELKSSYVDQINSLRKEAEDV